MDRKVVGLEEWRRARVALLKKEKEFARLRDELSGEIRRLPWRRLDKEYVFAGPDGPVALADLFGDHSQLVVYHFMFGPEWKEGCRMCSYLIDHIAPTVAHLRRRDTALALVSRGPLEALQAFRQRMGWDVTWVSSAENDFNDEFSVSVTPERADKGDFHYNYVPHDAPADAELPGLSVFAKAEPGTGAEDGEVLHTYSTYARGLESFMTTYRLLDIVPKGRNEADLKYGMEWVRFHDDDSR